MKWTLCLFLGALGFVAGSQSTVDNLSCDLCFENGFRYIKDKFRFLCVPRVIPAMRARFIYTKADCLKLKIDQRLLVGSQYVVSSNVSDHMPRRIPTEAPLADRLQSMESVFNTSKLPVSTLKSLESSQPFFTAQPSTTVAPRQLPSQRMATMPSMSRVGITQPPRQLSTTTPIPATTQPPKLTTATTVANKMDDAPPVTESASVMSMGIPVPGSEFIAIPIPGNWSDANLDQEEIHPINLTFVENGTGLPFVGNSQKLNPQNETNCTNASKPAHPDWKLSQSNGFILLNGLNTFFKANHANDRLTTRLIRNFCWNVVLMEQYIKAEKPVGLELKYYEQLLKNNPIYNFSKECHLLRRK